MEFVGHGALGWDHPPAWARYFAVVGINHGLAFRLMPVVGVFDIAMAVAILIYPMRGVVLYMTAWGLLTALLRPLSGEPIWEAVERAGNFGALFALFLLCKGGSASSWLRFVPIDHLEGNRRTAVSWVLRLTTVALLLGHGALGLIVQKPLLGMHYGAIGIHAPWFEQLVGGFEIVLAVAVLVRPGAELLGFVLIWKLATEALSPIAGSPVWVFIEHGGSYAAPLALAYLSERTRHAAPRPAEPAPA
jgi:hypothetical protein